MLAVAEGDPGTGWALTLGAHHVLTVAAWFSEAGQRDIFGSSGEFRAPHRALPSGTAEPADGGYVVTGTWDYCSGSAHATHFMCNAMIAGTTERITSVMPMDQVTVLDDWGGGATLGLNSSGSNSVRVDSVFVPARRTAPADWTHGETMAPGAARHGPLYCGRIYALYHAGLVIPVIGAARAALAEDEQIIKTKLTYFPPQVPRYTHPDYQRTYGHALALTDSADAIVLHVGDRYMELAERWAATGDPFTREDDARLYAMIQQAGQLAVQAVQAVQEIFAAASSSAAKCGTRLQRYYRDVAMYQGHIASQHLTTAAELARVHFALPTPSSRPPVNVVGRCHGEPEPGPGGWRQAMASTQLPSKGPVRLGSVDLPPGRLLSGHFDGETVVWATDHPVPRSGWVWAELSALHPQTGLVPIQLDDLHLEPRRPWDNWEFGQPEDPREADDIDVAALLESEWRDVLMEDEDDPEWRSQWAPFAREWPGLAPAESTPLTPPQRKRGLDVVLPGIRGAHGSTPDARIGLVAAERPADVLAVTGWGGMDNRGDLLLPLTAVLRSWEDRFGARVIDVGFADLRLFVERPPRTRQAALLLAAEQVHLADDCIDGWRDVRRIAARLLNGLVWTFWWD